MSWQQMSAMAGGNGVPGVGVGPGGNMGPQEMGGPMHGNGNGGNQPHATEYTLQGVMRFLQTEWHRHERDRNAWEIERQEMKGRIASLEGSARRSDASQKALKRYVTILEKKVKEQAQQLKAAKADAQADEHAVKPPPAKVDRDSVVQEKLKPMDEKSLASTAGDEIQAAERQHEEDGREDLKGFLDQTQAEFAYLMITPANPMPPRDSPPLPMIEDLRETDAYGMPVGQQQPLDAAFQALRLNQNHVNEGGQRAPPNAAHQQSMPQAPAARGVDMQSAPMVRSGDGQTNVYTNTSDWQTASGNGNRADDINVKVNDVVEYGQTGAGEQGDEKRNLTEADGWDFSEGSTMPEAPTPPQNLQTAPQRPDTDSFPPADSIPKSPHRGPNAHRRKSSMSRRRSTEHELSLNSVSQKPESGTFKLRFGLRGHLNTVRTVIFSGGGSPGEPEICTAGDDGLIKRFHIPRENPAHQPHTAGGDLDVPADFTHRGHSGAVLCLTSWSPSPNFSTGGRAQGDGWIFSGGQDASIRVWERGRVDPKATVDGHTDAIWAICVLPATLGAIFGQNSSFGTPDRILLVSGAADGTVKVWAITSPPQLSSPQPAGAAGRRGVGSGGRVRGNSMSSGSQFPSSPQPNMASSSPFHSTLVHDLRRSGGSSASPTCITPLSNSGEAFVVSYSDATIIVYDTRTGEEIGSMASLETYDNTINTSVNAVVATTGGLDQHSGSGLGDEESGGPTGGGGPAGSGVEGVIISGHEDRYIRFFDANSGQCTYSMLAHPAAIASLSLSPDGLELVSAGHDASLRFWSLEKRACSQEITSHRVMRGEGVCSVVWSQDGRWVVSGGGDGIVKVFAR